MFSNSKTFDLCKRLENCPTFMQLAAEMSQQNFGDIRHHQCLYDKLSHLTGTYVISSLAILLLSLFPPETIASQLSLSYHAILSFGYMVLYTGNPLDEGNFQGVTQIVSNRGYFFDRDEMLHRIKWSAEPELPITSIWKCLS